MKVVLHISEEEPDIIESIGLEDDPRDTHFVRLHLGINERRMVTSWFKQVHSMIGAKNATDTNR